MASKKSAKKPAAKPKDKDKKTVDVNADPLADLGLDTATELPPTTPAPAAATAAAAAEPEAGKNEEVDVGEIEFGFSEFVPTAKRKAEGSKYKFDLLPAPAVFEDGPHKGKPKIANFVVTLQPGTEEDKLRRSVQSATTQANKQGSDKGKYFVSRSGKDKDGKFVMIVYRTDDKAK